MAHIQIISVVDADLHKMDLGVGSFVFSQGVVSAIPILKNPAYLTGPVTPKIVTTTKKIIPLLLLGLVRVITVKGTEYPVSVTKNAHFRY